MSEEQPNKRRTLEQMHNDAMASQAGMGAQACPNCGCRDSRVIRTWKTGDGTKRARICRHCGTRLTTCEVTLPAGFEVRIEKK